MAVSVLGDLSAALSQTFDSQLARQWNAMARTISLLEAKPGNGKNVAWAVSTSGQTAATYTEGSDVGAGELLINAKLPMVLSWGLYRNAFGLSELELKSALNSRDSAEQMINLLQESVFESVASLASVMNGALFNGTGSSNSFVGLDSALLASGSYAGQTVTGSLLVSSVDDNLGTNRALTLALMEAMEAAIFRKSGMRPDFIVTTPELHAKYIGLFTPIVRTPGDVARYNISVQDDGVFWKGIPVIRDKDCPAGKMYFLNRKSLHMSYMPAASFGDAVQFSVTMASGSNGDDSQEAFGIPITIQSLAKTGQSVKFTLDATAQVVVRRPGACGVINDLV